MPASDPIVLGIDPGSVITGFGVITQKNSRLIHLACGGIKTSSSDSFPLRLKKIYRALQKVVADTKPTAVAVESIFYRKNVKSAVQLAHARGVALLAAAEAGLEIFEYSPAEVKRATIGYGRSTKDQVQEMVRQLLCLPKSDTKMLHDSSDALAVALCHLNTYRTLRRSNLKVSSGHPTRLTYQNIEAVIAGDKR